jgi:hypothetical protein
MLSTLYLVPSAVRSTSLRTIVLESVVPERMSVYVILSSLYFLFFVGVLDLLVHHLEYVECSPVSHDGHREIHYLVVGEERYSFGVQVYEELLVFDVVPALDVQVEIVFYGLRRRVEYDSLHESALHVVRNQTGDVKRDVK